ncbi:hypothetical protein JOE57_001038 [Microlunatus panaciterrae]|uniref:TIGR04222 domain-containing protein n=1 Tax=Microlunatus panaciterrae TaxID=400768 RepID=A0ABS2RHT6_9ACTN|nr:hypothetical protein [Microlunatus panaciterrae]MBM7798117.1 hypothetical protein [Microlunatus panaciterrae]
MGTTGLIYAAIAIAWLAYLVPLYAKRRDAAPAEEDDPTNRFSDSMRIIKRGTAPLLDQDLAEIPAAEVSTPLTRRAAIEDLRRLERVAAKRRRRVLVALMMAVTVAVAVWTAGLGPWWSSLIPGGLLLAFVVVARISVNGMRRRLDARYAEICRGSDESTVFLSRDDLAKADLKVEKKLHHKPKQPERTGALWDPVPITLPTYVSKPLAPRTVRTIDLSGPEVTSAGRQSVPVTADAPERVAPVNPVAEDENAEGDRRAS